LKIRGDTGSADTAAIEGDMMVKKKKAAKKKKAKRKKK